MNRFFQKFAPEESSSEMEIVNRGKVVSDGGTMWEVEKKKKKENEERLYFIS